MPQENIGRTICTPQKFCPNKSKRNLIECLTNRTLVISTTDTIADELIRTKQMFLRIGYPECFNDRSKKINRNKLTLQTVKKALKLCVSSMGDAEIDMLSRRLQVTSV